MADSLRDQLIAAGYEAPKKEEKRKPRSKTNPKNKAGQHGSKPGNKKSSANKPAGNKPHGSNPRNNTRASEKSKSDTAAQQNAQAIEERKKLKARIKTLIDDNKVDNWKGEAVYRYLVEKRIRELYVTDEIHKQLAERLIAVTRLNGDTYLVPREIALSIKEINPQWSVFNIDADTEDEAKLKLSESESDYADYKVPDDLKW